MPDLNDMLLFAEVAEKGSFTAAGDSLGTPKSRVSRRIAALEAQLGVRLLQRSTRKLALTEVGHSYLQHVQEMREAAQAAQLAVAQIKAEPAGVVRMSCPVHPAQALIGPMLPAFLAANPKVTLEMEVSNRAVDLLAEGIDVALRVRSELSEAGQLVVKRLGQTSSWVVASPEQLQRQGVPRQPEDLQRLDVMGLSGQKGMARFALQGPKGEAADIRVRARYMADDFECLLRACVAGVGLCAMPDYFCQADIAAGRLVRVLPDWRLSPGIFHAVFPSRRGMVPAVRALLDHLAQVQLPSA
ncbi:LysR family transcriptional regulator [Comamonas serinivorans]|uniref:LysR family transcriptional regulator n=1 Tax=Comamonas serinivorans TaxID=1082851 RepID=A0A1Y0ET14_9BURK|nr:LysR family transcriptional regulator [Comamonas serinivorans]ARU06814.1 LysR family transcriptional regulator [Comamonas serinivorans]